MRRRLLIALAVPALLAVLATAAWPIITRIGRGTPAVPAQPSVASAFAPRATVAAPGTPLTVDPGARSPLALPGASESAISGELTAKRAIEVAAGAVVEKYRATLQDPRVRLEAWNAKRSKDGRTWMLQGSLFWTRTLGGRPIGYGSGLVAEVDAATGDVVKLSRRQSTHTTASVARQHFGLPVPEGVEGNVVVTYDLDTLEITGAAEGNFGGKAIALPPGLKMKVPRPSGPAGQASQPAPEIF